MKYYNMNILSKNRSTIYGISIFLIVFCHSSLNFENFLLLKDIKSIGNFGVDVFLLLSGISLYYSFEKNSSIKQFYSRRLKRVLLPTIIICVPYFIVEDFIVSKNGLLMFLYDISGISFYIYGKRTIWFITAILVFYLFYPLIYKVFDKFKWSFWALALLILIVLVFNFSVKTFLPTIFTNCEILLRRFPIFLLGCYFGSIVKQKKQIKIKNVFLVLLSVLCIVLLIIAYKNEMFICSYVFSLRYLNGLAAVPAAILFSLIGETKYISKAISVLAPYTLEIYLLHEKLLKYLTIWIGENHLIIINISAISIAVILAFLIKNLEDCILKKFNKF